jgi:uroporphyrinogen-III synthase
VPARVAEIYDQMARPLPDPARDLLADGGEAVVPLFSPRSARLFAGQAAAGGWDLSRVTAVSLSAAADRGLAGLAVHLRLIAPVPTREGMLATLDGL